MKIFRNTFLLFFVILIGCIEPMDNSGVANQLDIKEAHIVSTKTTSTPDHSIVMVEYHVSEDTKLKFVQGDKILPSRKGYESWDKKG